LFDFDVVLSVCNKVIWSPKGAIINQAWCERYFLVVKQNNKQMNKEGRVAAMLSLFSDEKVMPRRAKRLSAHQLPFPGERQYCEIFSFDALI